MEDAQQQSHHLSRELEERVTSLTLIDEQSSKEVKQLQTELQTAEQQVRELREKTDKQGEQYKDLKDTCTVRAVNVQ